jgi:hypothetical protein
LKIAVPQRLKPHSKQGGYRSGKPLRHPKSSALFQQPVEVAGKVNFGCAAPKGASDFERLAVSLKRYPDTKPEFFRRL